MRNEMTAHNLYPPIFLTYPIYQDSVKVVLLNEIRATEWEKISKYLFEHKYINNEAARKITGIIHRDKMSYLLRKWVSQGLLIQIIPPTGFVRGTKYKLPDRQEVKEL